MKLKYNINFDIKIVNVTESPLPAYHMIVYVPTSPDTL